MGTRAQTHQNTHRVNLVSSVHSLGCACQTHIQHQIVAITAGKTCIHKATGHTGIGGHKTGEAPLATENILQQFGIGTGPLMADVREGGHGTIGAAFLDGQLEGTQIEFAESLLAQPAVDAAAGVGLFVVQNEMFEDTGLAKEEQALLAAMMLSSCSIYLRKLCGELASQEEEQA